MLVVGVGIGDPAAALRRRRRASATPARSCSASRPTRSTPTATVVATHDMAGVTRRRRPRASSPSTSPATSSRCRRWCRRSRSTAAGCTSWPARASRSSAQPRPVTVDRFDVAADRRPGVLAIEVECSAGTYVRTLAADLGRLLGGGAHLRNLRRTAVGPFTIDEAGAARRRASCCRRSTAVRGMAAVDVDDGDGRADRQRAGAAGARPAPGRGRWSTPTATLLAVYERVPRRARPSRPVVLAAIGACGGRVASPAVQVITDARPRRRGRASAPSSRSAPTTACTSATRR